MAFDPVVIPNSNFIPSAETILYDAYELFEFDRTYWDESFLTIYPRLTKWAKTNRPEISKLIEIYAKDAKHHVNRSHFNLLKMISMLEPVFRGKVAFKSILSQFISANEDRVLSFSNANHSLAEIATLRHEIPPLVTHVVASTIVYIQRVDEQMNKILQDMERYKIETNPVMAYSNIYHFPKAIQGEHPVATPINDINPETIMANNAYDPKHFEIEKFYALSKRRGRSKTRGRTKNRSRTTHSKSRSGSRRKRTKSTTNTKRSIRNQALSAIVE